ncbi:plasmid pRiA4b ORF-3 family protein [bacterium]|nr:plasmid pRiA4b ORF-3 family protein [bacterium]
MKHTTYQFKITLDEINPSIWRRFKVDANINMHDLAYAILAVMGWAGGHLHQFIIDEVFYGVPNDEFPSRYETKDEREFKLSDIPSQKLNKFKFEYDFGDGWTHTLELEKTFESDIELKHPVCIEGARNCPPEDCGGIPGYENLVEAMQDPKHPEREELLEWLGKEYDPEDFDIGEINEGF